MIHKSSVAAQEIRKRDLRDETSSDSIRTSALRLSYNSAEFRGSLRHQSVQTEVHRESLIGTDSSQQVDFTRDEIADLKDQLERHRLDLDVEREKSSDREKLLVAQMNAIRDHQMRTKAEEEFSIHLTVSVKRVGIGEAFIPSGYDQVWVILSGSDAGDSDECSRISRSEMGLMTSNELRITQVPIQLNVPKAAGQYTLYMKIHLGASDGSKYEVTLGECKFPTFVPCLKERGTSEIHKLQLASIGFIEAELTVR